MAKKRNEEVDSGNATEKDANTIDDFVVQQPSLLECVQQKIR